MALCLKAVGALAGLVCGVAVGAILGLLLYVLLFVLMHVIQPSQPVATFLAIASISLPIVVLGVVGAVKGATWTHKDRSGPDQFLQQESDD